jgi:hypothetical protein
MSAAYKHNTGNDFVFNFKLFAWRLSGAIKLYMVFFESFVNFDNRI